MLSGTNTVVFIVNLIVVHGWEAMVGVAGTILAAGRSTNAAASTIRRIIITYFHEIVIPKAGGGGGRPMRFLISQLIPHELTSPRRVAEVVGR
jgi:hypothetical protein